MLSRFLQLGPIVVALLVGVSACGQDGETTQVTTTTATNTAGSGGAGHGGGGGAGTTATVEPKPLTVMNWNVKNFFNDKKDSSLKDEIVQTTAQYQQQLAKVGAVITAMNPDIVVLQEVENSAVLDDLNAKLGGTYGTRVLIDGNDVRGIDVGALSKLPFDKTVSHKEEAFSLIGTNGPNYYYARDCLELHLTFNGRRIALLGVHWLSKLDQGNDTKRLAEAQHTRAIADGLTGADPDLGVIVLGDFNDLPDSPPYLAAKGQAPTEYGDAPDAVTSADRWTFQFNGEHQLIDHQLSNPLLSGMLDPSRVAIRHGADVEEASDHAPVSATYSVR